MFLHGSANSFSALATLLYVDQAWPANRSMVSPRALLSVIVNQICLQKCHTVPSQMAQTFLY